MGIDKTYVIVGYHVMVITHILMQQEIFNGCFLKMAKMQPPTEKNTD